HPSSSTSPGTRAAPRMCCAWIGSRWATPAPRRVSGHRTRSNPRGAARSPRERRAASCRGLRAALALLAREANPEVRAGAVEHLDASLVQLHVLLDDGEPDPAALDRRHRHVRAAIERLEDLVALGLRDSRALVAHLEYGVARLLVELDGDD